MIDWKPINGQVLVEPVDVTQVGSIVIPDSVLNTYPTAIIIAMADDIDYSDKTKLEVGDEVYFVHYDGTGITFEGKDYIFLPRNSIVGKKIND